MKSPTQTAIPVAATPSESAHPGSMVYTVSSALIVVLLLIAAVAWLARRFGLASAAPKSHKLMKVEGSLSLGPRERVVVVEIAGKWLAIGISPSGMTPLSTLEKPQQNDVMAVTAVKGDFQSLFKTVLSAAKREKN